MRERIFVYHAPSAQLNLVHEYTVGSKIDDLTNLFLLVEDFLPNLVVKDGNNNVLPVMPAPHVKKLLKWGISSTSDLEREKLDHIQSGISSNKLRLIWVKIPNKLAMMRGEIRVITLTYSAYKQRHHWWNFLTSSKFVIRIKNKHYPLYYSLQIPKDYDFNQGRYLTGTGTEMTGVPPDQIRVSDTHDSRLYKMSVSSYKPFKLIYSFKPATQTYAASLLGLVTLSSMGFIMWFYGHIMISYDQALHDLYQKNVEIGIFLIAGSLVLPQLTSNDSIRSSFLLLYALPIIFGTLIILQ